MSSVQEALKAREERKKKEQQDKQSKVDTALEAYKSRKKSSTQSAVSDLTQRINSEIETIKKVSTPTYGSDSLTNTLNSTRESRISVSNLQKELESYKSYIDEDTYNSYSSVLSTLKDTYDSYLSVADIRSKFKDEEDYNNYQIGWLNPDAKVDAESVEARKEKYQSNTSRITELEDAYKIAQQLQERERQLRQGYARAGHGASYDARTGKYTYSDAIEDKVSSDATVIALRKQLEKYGGADAIKTELESLKSENTRYEHIHQAEDDHFIPITDEVKQTASKRDYSNASMEDLNVYDAGFRYVSNYLGDGVHYLDDDGNVVNAYTGKVARPSDEYSRAMLNNDTEGFYNSVIQDKLGMFLSASEDDLAEAYNRLSALHGNMSDSWASTLRDGDVNGWKQLTEDEITIYYYKLNTEGQASAYKFLEDMTTELTRRETQKRAEEISDAPFLKQIALNVASIPMNILGGAIAFAEDSANIIQGNEINPYSRAHSWQNDASAIRTDTAMDIDKLTGGIAIPLLDFSVGDAYQALMSGADSLAGSFLGGTGYGVLMGMGAASAEMKDLYERGASTEQMFLGGILAGAAEMVFEKYSIDKFVEMGDTKSIKDAVINILKQGGVEASEEAFTEIANTITDAIVMGSQAEVQDLGTLIKNVVNAGIGGFISGSGMGGIGSAVSYGKYAQQRTAHGQDIIDEGGVDTLKQLALDMAGVTQRSDSKNLTKLAGKVEKNASAKNVGKLSAQAENTIAKQNRTDIQKALVEKGLTKKEAKRVSEYLGSSTFTREQKVEIASDKRIKEVMTELLDDPKSAISERGRNLVAARLGIKINAENSGELSLRNDVDVKERVSETGKTTITETDENGKEVTTDITIDKKNPIAKVEYVDGERVVYFNTDHGTVEASKVKYANEEEGLLYEAFTDMNPAFANAVIKNYDSSVPIQTYINGMREGMILYGMHNFEGKDIAKNTFFSDLSETDQAFALKLGKAYAKADAKKANKDLHSAIKKAAEKAEASKGASTTEGTQNKAKKGNVYFEEGAKAETHKQHKKIISLAKHLAKAIGIDIVFYDSRITGKKAGQGANGYFDADTDTIYLDLQNAHNDAKTIAYTLSHELVHFIKKWSPQKFNTFAEFLLEQYASHGVSAANLLKRKMVELNTTDADLAYEEMIADACETMLLDSNAMVKLMELRKTDLELFEKIKLHILKILNDIREAYKSLGYQPTSDEAKALLGMKDVLEKFYSMFEEAAVDATKNYQALGTEGYNELVAKSTENANKTVFGEASVDVGKTESGVKHQLKAHKTVGEASIAYNDRHKKVHKAILQVGVESMYEMAEAMLPYLEVEGILPPDIPGKTIFKNGSYGKTGENTTLCVRTLTYEDFKDRVAEKIGRPLTVSESLLVSQKIYDIATEPQCIYCYVAADRKAYDEYLGEYWKAMDKYIKAMRKGGDSKALYTEYLAGRKDTDAQKKRWSQWESIAKSGKEYISASDLTTKRKRDSIIAKKNAFSDQIKDAQRYAQSASWAKTVCDYRAYKGDILKMTSTFVDMLNSEYGLRMYSFSDYTPAFIVENMQMIIDASVKGLKSLAYTKDTDYVEIFASTGQAINVSCFAKWDAELGTYVEDNRQGANWEKTKNLRKQYRNVGAVMVATNDAMVEWALKQDWVDVVIPYHIVKTGTTIANEYQWNNYTSESSDKAGNRAANIYPTEHNNDFATYSDLLKERGITPRFSRWYDMVASGELTEEQYMKLVNEVRLPASELSPVIPSFNLEAAKKSFGIDNEGNVIEGGFVDKGGYMGGWYRQGVDVNQEVMAVSEDIKAGKSSLDVEYGMSKAGKERVEQRYKKQDKNKKMTEEEKKAGEKLADFIESVSLMLDQSKISKRKLRIGVLTDTHKKIVEELMQEINPNFSATGYELWIDGTGADHINVRHGENGEHDSTMATREDRELIPWVANSPDGGEFIRDESGKLILSNRFFNADDSKAHQIRIHKMVDGDTVYVSECVLDSKNKRIYITSAYKKLAEKQKGSTNQLLNIDSNKSPQPTSETSFDGSATNGSISHPNDSVKKNSENSQKSSNEHQQKKTSDRILMGSLFSGGGTLEAGLVYQMLDKEFAVEYNKKIASAYTDNHGKEHMFVGDVRDFNSKEKQDVFYLHASPVCKNYSSASHSGGETTLDITTAQATARVLEEQMPQVFTVENVKRYIGSEAYNIITNKLDELGYTWDVAVYKASDYGNATKRERMIIRAIKDGQMPAKPQKASNITSWGEATRDLWETDLIPSYLVKSKYEAIKNTPQLKGVNLTKLDKPLLIYDTTKEKKVSFAWVDELAPTLTTKCGDARIIMPDGRVYAPTPKFMGRIQGLPDDYKYPKATTNAFKIIGNGIPTQLTKAVMGGVLDSAYEQTHDGRILYQKKRTSSSSYAPTSYAPTFYSQMGREIDTIKMDKIGATSLVNYLKGKGIKHDEIKWSGIEAFLEGKKSVTKAELQEFIAGSQLEIEETIIDNTETPMTKERKDKIASLETERNNLVNKVKSEWKRILGTDELDHYAGESLPYDYHIRLTTAIVAKKGATPIGQEYKAAQKAVKEICEESDYFGYDNAKQAYVSVLRNPDDFLSSYELTATEEAAISRLAKAKEAWLGFEGVPASDVQYLKDRGEDIQSLDGKINAIRIEHRGEQTLPRWGSYKLKGGDNYREMVFQMPDSDYTNEAMETHWRQFDFKGVLAHARVQDFTTDGKKMLFIEEIQSDWHNEGHKEGYKGSTPDAPFHDTYHEYVLKRLLRMAAEEGYDGIGWTTAKTQDERWADKQEHEEGKGKSGNLIGYTIEYDQDIPKFLRKYGKKWGATVGKSSVANTDVWSMDITEPMVQSVLYEGQAKFQKKKVSNRTILANALETTAQNDIEKNKLAQYKEKIALIESEEEKLAELRGKIKELSFAKGARDTKAIKDLQFEANQTANRINTYDRQLLNLESTTALKGVLEREKQKAYKRAEEKGKEALDAYREKMTKTQRELLTRYKDQAKAQRERMRETHDKGEAKDKLQKLILKTINWLSYPKKEDVKCPDILKEPYKEFLESIDLSSKRLQKGGDPTQKDLRLASAMDSLATAIEKIKTAQNPNVTTEQILDSGYLDLPENFVELLRTMAEDIKKKMVSGNPVVNDIHSTDVKAITKLIRTLNHAIKEMSTLYANLRFANVQELGHNDISFLDSMGEADSTNGVKDFVEWDNALPYYAFKRFGEGGESIFEGLMDAQDKLARLAEVIFDFKDKTWTDKDAKEWGEDTHTITLPSGHTLTLTTADAMSIYCLSRRDNKHGMNHLLAGGVRVIGIKKGAKKASDSRSTLTQEDVIAIVSSLTDRQRAVAEAIQGFMSSVCSEWGNEISMKRFLTKEFNEKFYFPIESNDENLDTKDPSAQQSDLYRLLNISATKPLTPGANNEVIIRNIFDVFTNHSSDMARLNSFGMALLDYMKWLNYREKSVNEENGQITVRGVRKSMERAYGEKAKSYVINLIKDINGRHNDNADNSFLMSMMRMSKTASVGNNLRVAFLQFTSYPRASMVLSTGSLAKGLTRVPQIEKAKKYCGIALWKSFGFYDTNIARSIEDQIKGATNIRQKIIELSMKTPEWADAITWGALWNACEYEVAKTTKNKVGSEEFYEEVGKKLREVVYATQVVDSILTRSQIMRSKSGLTQTATAYMSEPTLTANILMDAGFQFQKEKRITGSAKTAWKKTGKIVGRAVANYCVLQLLTSLAESLADAWRDDDDEEFGEKFIEAFKENLITNIIPFNKLPIISDIAELILSRFGIGFVSSDNMATTWITQIADALDVWTEVLGEAFGGEETSKTVYNAIYKTAKAVSSVTGVSVSGAMREVVTLWNNTAGAYDSTLKIRLYESTNAELGQELYEAIVEGNDRQIESLEAQFDDQKAIDSALRKALRTNEPRIKEAAQADVDGDVSEYNRIVTEILDEGYFSEENIKAAIKSEINELTEDEDETSSTPKKQSIYEQRHYYQAVSGGYTSLAREIKEDIVSTLVENGKDRDEAEESFESSFRNYVGKMYKDGEASRSTASNMLTQYGGYDANETYWKLKEWDFDLEHGEDATYSKYTDFYDAVKTGRNIKAVIKEYTDNGVKAETLASQITKYYKPLYKNMSNAERAGIKGYLLNAYVLLGYNRYEKSKDIDKWLED